MGITDFRTANDDSCTGDGGSGRVCNGALDRATIYGNGLSVGEYGGCHDRDECQSSSHEFRLLLNLTGRGEGSYLNDMHVGCHTGPEPGRWKSGTEARRADSTYKKP